MLEFKGITKRFPGVLALENVSLAANRGEVLAVIGENGAGKSTLMKILGGVYQPDDGSISLGGHATSMRDPNDAVAKGVQVVWQELSVLDNLDIAGNIFLGREKLGLAGLLKNREMETISAGIMKRVGLSYPPTKRVSELALAEQQLVEIGRALSTKVQVLVLDEPTSSLTLEETQRLLGLIRELKAEGVTILFISHRLDEVKQIADRVVVLKDGRNAGSLEKDEITHDAMVRMMVGRDLDRGAVASGATVGDIRLKLSQVRTKRYPSQSVDLELRGGEIVGMVGLVGAGRSELARAIFGVDHLVSGTVEVDGKPVSIKHADDAIEAGVYLVPEDRRGAGLVVEMGVRENVTLPSLPSFATAGLVNKRSESVEAAKRSSEFKVKTATIETTVSTLSGGNQQKVVLARWLPMNPKVMIFDEPTRGIDVGSKAEIYEQMRVLARQGVAIWMISSDMEEIFNISDRIVVLCEGRITGSVPRAEASEEGIMKLAVGEAK